MLCIDDCVRLTQCLACWVDEIADHLSGQDLLTGRERGEVRQLLANVYKRLNPLDAKLPQVRPTMGFLLLS